MTDLLERSIHLINNYVSLWTKKYLHHTSYVEETPKGHTFMTVFSQPTPSKPIPTAVVKVFFNVPDLTDPSEKSLSFRFENDSLIHLVGRTIRLNQMEKWIETILQRKERTCRIMFLGTEFEQTRIINQRMDEVLHEKRVEILKEAPMISPDLLEFESELVNQFTTPEEEKERELRMLNELLYHTYRQIDTEDLGFISYEECLKLFKLMGLELGRHQQEEIFKRLDHSQTRIIEFKDLQQFGAEILHAIYCQNLAMKDLKEKEEESRFEAQWMLYGELRDIYNQVVKICKERDEEETYLVSPEMFRSILEEMHKFSEDELSQIMRFAGDQPFKYASSDKLLEDAIFENLVKGLFEAHKSKLELFLIELMSSLDKEKTGKIKVNEMMTLLQNCKELKLSRAHQYALQSYVQRDKEGMVDYKQQARKLSAVIKKYFNVDLVDQKSRFVQMNKVDENVPLKSEEEVRQSIKNVGL